MTRHRTTDGTPADLATDLTPEAARRSRWLLVGTVLAALALYLPLLGPSLVGQSVFVETGVVLRFEPWSSTGPAGEDGLTIAHDTVDFYLPRTSVFHDALRSGDVALWNPWSAGGAPLAAVPDTALLSPLSLPYFVLPLSLAPAWVRLLEVLVAMGFLAAFLRRLSLAPGPALLGGLLYSTSGFLVLWNNWPQAQVAALVPALFWSVERALQVRRPGALVPVALAVASMVLASFPIVLVYAMYLLGPYVLVRTVRWRPRWPELAAGWALVAGGVGLGVALVAFQLLPFASHLGALDLSYREQSPAAHAPTQSLLTVVAPYLFGTETDLSFFGYRNTVETLAFFGVAGTCLALLAFVLHTRDRVPAGVPAYFLGASVTLALVAYGTDDVLALVQRLPLVGTSYIGRVRSVLLFSLAVLAAVGAERLVRLPGSVRPVRWPAVAGGAVAVAVGVVALREAAAAARAAGGQDAFARGAVVPLLVAAALAAVLAVAVSRRRPAVLALALLPALVAVESFAFIAPRWPSTPPGQFYPRTAVHEFLGERLGSDRYAAGGAMLYPSTNDLYRLRSVTGHAFQSPTWKSAVARVDPEVRQGPTLSFLGSDADTAGSPLLDRLGARWFVNSVNAPVLGPVEAPPPGSRTVASPAGRTLQVALEPRPRRALVLELAAPLTGSRTGRLHATFTDAQGAPVGEVVRHGLSAGRTGVLHVPVPAEDGPLASATSVRLRWEGVSAVLSGDAAGAPVLGSVLPADDGLRLALADEGVVYERLRALPRIRFASVAVHEPDAAAGLDRLARGGVPDTAVLLQDPPGDMAAGSGGRVEVLQDGTDRVRVRASSAAGGWVVVADAMQHGWEASVGGRPAAVLVADHAGVAVRVPAGEHDVELRYAPPGLRTGAAVSSAAVLLLALVVLGTALQRRRRRVRPVPAGAPAVSARPSLAPTPHRQAPGRTRSTH